ncbi:MAG: hypothetical protein AAF720_02210 [Pseudomonadota bacterium]
MARRKAVHAFRLRTNVGIPANSNLPHSEEDPKSKDGQDLLDLFADGDRSPPKSEVE